MQQRYKVNMSKNLNIRLSPEEWDKLNQYCLDTGRSKTILFKAIIQRLGNPDLEKILSKSRYSGSSD